MRNIGEGPGELGKGLTEELQVKFALQKDLPGSVEEEGEEPDSLGQKKCPRNVTTSKSISNS